MLWDPMGRPMGRPDDVTDPPPSPTAHSTRCSLRYQKVVNIRSDAVVRSHDSLLTSNINFVVVHDGARLAFFAKEAIELRRDMVRFTTTAVG